MASRFRSYGLLDCRSPVEWSYPLNRGLVGEWAVVPLSGWRGSLALHDLTRGGHAPYDSTLSGGVTWQGRQTPGSYGSLKFDGSTGTATTGIIPALQTGQFNAELTLACWLKPTFGNYQEPVANGDGFTNKGYGLQTVSSPTLALYRNAWNTSIGATISTTGWTHAVGTFSASGDFNRLYINGVLGASETGTHVIDISAPGVIVLASGLLSTFYGGNLDDVIWWNRALTAQEVAALYAESRQGNPKRWRWVRGTVYSFPGAAPAGARVNVAAYMKRSVRISPSLGATR